MATCGILKKWKDLRNLTSMTASSLRVLYKGNGILAIQKPYGLPVLPGPGSKVCLTDFLEDLRSLHSLPEAPHLAHRIDRDCSGILLLTYNSDTAAEIAKLFEERTIVKRYLAVCIGIPPFRAGPKVIKAPIFEGEVNGRAKMMLCQDSGLKNRGKGNKQGAISGLNAKKAVSVYQMLANNENTCSLIEFHLKTGYKHQLRVHSSDYLQCPILGDHKYALSNEGPQVLPIRLIHLLGIQGVKSETRTKGTVRPWQRQLVPMHLVASEVTIPDFTDGMKDVTIRADIPDFFIETLKKCRLFPTEEHFVRDLMKKKGYKKRISYEWQISPNERNLKFEHLI